MPFNRVFLALMSVCTSGLLIVSCTSVSSRAASYNDEILEHQGNIITAFNTLDTALNNYSEAQMEYAHVMAQAAVKKAMRSLDSLGPFKGDSSLYVSSDHLFKAYESLLEWEYEALIEIMLIPDSLFSIKDQEKAFALEDAIRKRFEIEEQRYREAQLSFGKSHGVMYIERTN